MPERRQDTRPKGRSPVGANAVGAERYARQLCLEEIGAGGQRALGRARVLLVGLGGLGSSASLYLAAAGIGELVLVDDDRVQPSNLNRQVLYTEAVVGRPKVEAACDRLAALNSTIELETHDLRLDAERGASLVASCDVVIDATDAFATRFVLNELCIAAARPLVSGAVHRFDGQVSVFWADRGPCYRCLVPEEPAATRTLDGAEAGVLGVLPGIIGALEAGEAIKILLGREDILVGRLIALGLLGGEPREIAIPKDPRCPACGVRSR